MRLFVGRLKRSKRCNVNFTRSLQQYDFNYLFPNLATFQLSNLITFPSIFYLCRQTGNL
jgi:hypothetical protein